MLLLVSDGVNHLLLCHPVGSELKRENYKEGRLGARDLQVGKEGKEDDEDLVVGG
jgi:hypothetical protein